MILICIILSVFAYFIGSVPFGSIIGSKVAGIDITKEGSGNIGATNVARALGLRWGILTFCLDLLKGYIPVYFLMSMFDSYQGWGLIIFSLAILLGHRFSLFMRFRGGKGVATAFGIFLALSPLAALIAFGFFLFMVFITDYISLGSVTSALLMPFILLFLKKPVEFIITASLMAVLICLAHKDNIVRLINGEERRWKNKRS